MMHKLKNFLAVLLSSAAATFLVAGVGYAATTISSDISTGGLLTVSGLASLNGQASTTQLSASGRIYVGSTGTTTILGDAATSTFSGGLNLSTGCFAVNGTCVGSTGTSSVTSVSAANSTLTITPTTGAVVAGLNLANVNTWTAVQYFPVGIESAGALHLGTTTATSIIIGRSVITTTMPGALTIGGTLTASGTATSTFVNGINIAAGCFSVAGSCISSSTPGASLSGVNTWTALQIFNAQATSTQFTATSRLYVGSATTSSIILPTTSTSTFGGIQGTALNITGTATSTFANGITLSGGCVTVQGVCIGTSSGASLSANNTWTGTQTFTGATTTFSSGIITPIMDSPGGLTIGTSTATQIVIGRTGSATYLSGSVAFGPFGAGSQISGLLYGACTIGTSTPISASTSAIVGCSTAAINLTTSYRVFITPVGIPSGLIVQAASTTATNLISLQIFNANSTTTSTTASSVSFFAVQ